MFLLNKSMIQLRPYQQQAKEGIYRAWDEGHKNVLLLMPTGSGKCLGRGTPVLMYDGSIKPVQDVKPNDLLMGPDSTPRLVKNTCVGTSELFRITPVKGDPWICNDVHILSLRHTTSKKIVDVPLPDYLKSSNNFKKNYKQFRVAPYVKGHGQAFLPSYMEETDFKVESIGEGDYYGFELDGDSRFLLGDFTVTHNTKTFVDVVNDTVVRAPVAMPTAILVHRKELVSQISMTLAEEGVHHNIIASRKDIRAMITQHRRELGKAFYRVDSPVTVISVDTLISRQDNYKNWVTTIRQTITDEAAHVLRDNKWGKALALFPNARGLGVTATPERLDRKGLGSHVDGVFDTMVEGPTTSWLIQNGFLSKYKIAVPPSDFEQHLESKSDKSDYSKKAMMKASKQSHIVGDVVKNYQKFANGKQAILFATDVATAKEMAQRFNDAGIPAASLDGTTKDSIRVDTIEDFKQKKIRVLINVDLFDEGLDVPGIECVIMARPTKSLGKFLQMIGRGLRLAADKPYTIIIDHVGNVKYHGLPCDRRNWTLDRIKKRGEKLNLIRICRNYMCNAPYDRSLTECPWCGEPAVAPRDPNAEASARPRLEEVDGDLFLMDPEDIRALEARAELEDPAVVAQRVTHAANAAAGMRAAKNQMERIETQKRLAESIANWAGVMRSHYGYTDRTIHKKFYLEQGQTITEALGEPKADMEDTIRSLSNV